MGAPGCSYRDRKHHIYLGEETSIDNAWSKLKEAYGDPQKRTYRWTPEARRRLLDIEAEYEEDVETSTDNARLTLQEAFQAPETRSYKPLPDTMVNPHKTTLDTPPSNHPHHRHPTNAGEINPNLGPRNIKTTSTQTKDKYARSQRPQHLFKCRGHYHTNTRRKNPQTGRGWSSRQGPTLGHISFLCKVILPPSLTFNLRLRKTTLRMGLQYSSASTFHKVCEQLPHILQCQVYGLTSRASTSISRNTKKRDDNHKADLDQIPSTTKVGNIQTHTRAKTTPKGTTKNKKSCPWRPQHHINPTLANLRSNSNSGPRAMRPPPGTPTSLKG